MKIAILGAGECIGLLSVNYALKQGYEVIALSNDVTKIPDHPLLTKIKGSTTVPEDIKRAIKNADAVLITVCTKNKKPTTLFSDIAPAIVKVAEEINFSAPIITITGFGAGESKGYLSFFMSL